MRTTKGAYEAGRLVLAAGRLDGRPGPPLAGRAVPERQVLAWLQPSRPELFTPERFPVFNLQVEEGRYYGFPVYEVPGFKFGRYHHRGESMRRGRRAPGARRGGRGGCCGGSANATSRAAAGATMGLRACMFTNTPDEHFVLDRHPDHPQVVLASPCSGHGYKFCSVIGEILADLATGDGTTRHDIAFLGLDRPGLAAEALPAAAQ